MVAKEVKNEDVMKPLKRVDEAVVIGRALSNPLLTGDARKKAEDFTGKFLAEEPYKIKNEKGEWEVLGKKDFEAMPEDRRGAIVSEVMENVVPISFEQATRVYSDFLKTDASKSRKLAPLIQESDVREGVRQIFLKKDKEGKKNLLTLVDEFINYSGTSDIAKRIADGKTIPREELEEAEKLARNGVAKQKYDDMKSAGYTDSTAAAAGKVAAIVYDGFVDRTKMVALGAKLLAEKSKGRMKKIDENFEEVIAEGVREHFKNDIKSSRFVGSGDSATPASRRVVQLLYTAENDMKYGLGSREFSEFYKN